VQPQTFGGSDPNVKTMGGRAQALRTAMGRMKLFWDGLREEHAAAAENSVRCTVDNMDEQMRVVVQGDVENSFETIVLLKSQLVGDFLAYPESEEGLPTSYDEMQAQLMQLVEAASKNPFLNSVLAEPDTKKLVARYLLPYGAKMPGDAERARLKTIVQHLAKAKPQQGAPMPPPQQGMPPQPGPMLPSILPSPDYDDFNMAVEIATTWLQENWQTSETPGFQNVLLFMKACKQMATTQALKMQAQQAALAPPPPGGAPPPGAHPPG
jgi:hypothetical protein